MGREGPCDEGTSKPQMNDLAMGAFFAQLCSDEALQRKLAGCADPGELADTLAALGVHAPGATQLMSISLQSINQPPVIGIEHAPPRQWLPNRIFSAEDGYRVEWLHHGLTTHGEPFFEMDAAKAAQLPLNLVARCSTPIASLGPFAMQTQPDGLVFHLSRCGSTLVAQMLRALDHTVAVPEAPIFDQAMMLFLSGEVEAQIVQGVCGALLRDRTGHTQRRFMKLDSWHTPVMPKLSALFPQTKLLFLFRDPVEVLVSQNARPGLHARRGGVPLDLFGLPGAEQVADEDYIAWVIAGLARAALEAAETPRLMLCDYADLPGAVSERILPHFGIEVSEGERAALAHTASRNAKIPTQRFSGDTAMKQAAAGEDMRAIASAQGLPVLYSKLREAASR